MEEETFCGCNVDENREGEAYLRHRTIEPKAHAESRADEYYNKRQ